MFSLFCNDLLYDSALCDCKIDQLMYNTVMYLCVMQYIIRASRNHIDSKNYAYFGAKFAKERMQRFGPLLRWWFMT